MYTNEYVLVGAMDAHGMSRYVRRSLGGRWFPAWRVLGIEASVGALC